MRFSQVTLLALVALAAAAPMPGESPKAPSETSQLSVRLSGRLQKPLALTMLLCPGTNGDIVACDASLAPCDASLLTVRDDKHYDNNYEKTKGQEEDEVSFTRISSATHG